MNNHRLKKFSQRERATFHKPKWTKPLCMQIIITATESEQQKLHEGDDNVAIDTEMVAG